MKTRIVRGNYECVRNDLEKLREMADATRPPKPDESLPGLRGLILKNAGHTATWFELLGKVHDIRNSSRT